MLYINKNYRKNRKLTRCTILTLIVLMPLFPIALLAAPIDNQYDNINVLIESTDRKHQLFYTHFQTFLLNQPEWPSEKYNKIAPLLSAIKRHAAKNNNILAANLIFNNMTLLNENYDNGNIFYIIDILLKQNDTKTAHKLFDIIKNEGDQALISNAAYVFATFSFKKNEWEKTLKFLDGVMGYLPEKNYHHALLMQGISFQKKKEQRTSMQFYEKIKPSSTYYLSARLNMAIANIKQGWWTDAHNIIQSAIKSAKQLNQEEALNRLYLTLAYSLMSQQYYRDSRNFFRNIGINSIFSTRALLGISLTAASQDDFVGALSAAHMLKDKQTYDLSVDESYLLLPYFYEQLQQPTTASAGYLEAINYYQKRISDIQSILDADIDLKNYPLDMNNNNITLKINNNPIDFSSEYPDYFLKNYLSLNDAEKYIKHSNSENIKIKYDQLNAEYENIIVTMIRKILKKRIKHLDSYMGQSRFGLANLYDNNLIDN